MGHGDKLCVCDCNFPASQVATRTVTGKHVILSVNLPDVLKAVCSVLPLDFFYEKPVLKMAPQEGLSLPVAGVEVSKEIDNAIWTHCPDVEIYPVERFAFYQEAEKCFAVVQTLERRPYGNVILQKGCVGPDGLDLKP
jgi:L-fucose mutarotase